jgi:periplasmic divalent cation tolerance protein
MKRDCIVIYVTCASKYQAHRIAKTLLDDRLIACANIISGIESRFLWKGRLDSAKEALIIMKTVMVNFRSVEKAVKELHSYDCPEIIAVPISNGSKEYLNWIEESIRHIA